MIDLTGLVELGRLLVVETALDFGERERRRFLATPSFVDWLDARAAAGEPSPQKADLTPAEQLDYLIYAFVSGRPFAHGEMLKLLKDERHGVWELKTPDLRVFGWFPQKDAFVAVFGDWADRIKDFGLYRGYSIEVRRIRREMGADALRVRGVTPDDVVSV